MNNVHNMYKNKILGLHPGVTIQKGSDHPGLVDGRKELDARLTETGTE